MHHSTYNAKKFDDILAVGDFDRSFFCGFCSLFQFQNIQGMNISFLGGGGRDLCVAGSARLERAVSRDWSRRFFLGGGPLATRVVAGPATSRHGPSVSASRSHLPMAAPQGGYEVRFRSFLVIAHLSLRVGGRKRPAKVMAIAYLRAG